MNDEYLKDITIAAIENGLFDKQATSKETAIEIANFITTLRDGSKKFA